MSERAVLKVRNPRADISQDEPHPLPPRLDTLEGKRIAVMTIKPDANIYLDRLAELLRERYPTSTFDRLEGRTGRFVGIDPKLPGYDAYIYGVKNTAGFNMEAAPEWEINGTPGVTLITDFYVGQTKRHAMSYGVPFRMYAVPCEKWFDVSEVEEFHKMAENSVDDIIRILTDPLTEEEKHPKKFEYDISDLEFEGRTYTEAYSKFQKYFMDHKFTDGLAVAPPTQEAVEEMLSGTSRKPDEVIGSMTPTRGICTIEKIAINAVMAGAKPEYLPVIITAVELLIDPGLLSWHALAAINSDNIAIYVGGPIAKELGMSGRGACFGPGTPANNIIGHAVSLCALNCGWIEFETHGGMYGQPSRFCNLVFTDNEELSPWETYSESRGFGPEDSTVMVEEVFYLDGTFQLGAMAMPSGLWTRGLMGDLENIAGKAVGDRPALETMRKGNRTIHGATAFKGGDEIGAVMNGSPYILVMYPGEAQQLAEAGFTREKLARFICDYKAIPWEDFDEDLQAQIRGLAETGSFPGLTLDNCKPGGKIPVMNSNRIAIMVAGHMSGQTIGMHCLGSYGSRFTPVEGHGPFDSPFHIKKITGATLTKAGR